MPKIMLLAATVAALGMAPQPTEAQDRGFGSRHFSEQAGPMLPLRQRGLDFDHRGFFGRPPPFASRHFDHFGNRAFVFKFGHVSQFEPRHFGHFAQGGLVLKFGDGNSFLRFGHIPLFKPDHFGDRHQHQGPFFGFDEPRPFRQWHDREFAFRDWHGVPGHPESMPGLQGDRGGGLHGGAPPEALLRQLEQMGFQYVPELLRNWDR
jgi:hypothetical protein